MTRDATSRPGTNTQAEPADRVSLENAARPTPEKPTRPREIGGPAGREPTRYGDWERNGRCTDF
ncbi:MAG: DUF1674 domain-containing protein [Acidisphaera sp.]|nr:DUF1674 domain-containing protein [Acidisphaera sp.]